MKNNTIDGNKANDDGPGKINRDRCWNVGIGREETSALHAQRHTPQQGNNTVSDQRQSIIEPNRSFREGRATSDRPSESETCLFSSPITTISSFFV